MTKHRALVTLLAVASASLAGRAQEESPLAERGDPWTLKFEPAAWYAAPSGSIAMPGDSTSGNGRSHDVDELNLDSPRVSPFGELQLRRGPWRVSLQGFAFSADDRGAIATSAGQFGGVSYASGDRLESSLDVYSFAMLGAYEFYTFETGELPSGGAKARSSLLAVAGVRAISADVDFLARSGGTTLAIGSVSGDALHAHPTAGVRWELELFEDFSIDVLGAIGGLSTGDAESWSAEILTGFQWNPTHNLGVQVGYRQLLMGIEDGESPAEFSWQGGMAGLYAGATLRF